MAIIGTGALVYLNSFKGQFLFDDQTFLENPSFHRFWPLAPSMITRPIVGFSLALNHAISGIDVWSYHAFNLTIHILASLALFGVVRRTLLTDKLKERFGQGINGAGFISGAVVDGSSHTNRVGHLRDPASGINDGIVLSVDALLRYSRLRIEQRLAMVCGGSHRLRGRHGFEAGDSHCSHHRIDL